MKFNIIKNIALATLYGALLLPLSSCVKDQFTTPGTGANMDPPDAHATMTIKQFKQNYYGPVLNSQVPVKMPDTSTVVLSGIINADDKSGNFYKILSFQDSTGGLQIKIDGSNLYRDYPIGRRIFIRMKGLYLFNYGGTLEIGGYVDLSGTYPGLGSIAASNLNDIIIKGQWGLTVPVANVTISKLINADYIDAQSMLYQIDSTQFLARDTVGRYANALNKGSTNITLESCIGGTLIVRTSGYAGFAPQRPAKGQGSILGIYTYYQYSSGNNFQFTIRDTSDVRFYGPRCH